MKTPPSASARPPIQTTQRVPKFSSKLLPATTGAGVANCGTDVGFGAALCSVLGGCEGGDSGAGASDATGCVGLASTSGAGVAAGAVGAGAAGFAAAAV